MVDLSDARTAVQDHATQIFTQAMDFVYEETRRMCPVGPGPGPHTVDSILVLNDGLVGDMLHAEITAEGPAADFQDAGTQGPYVIEARNAPALAFPWPNGPAQLADRNGIFHFKYVTHPGVPAQNWFRVAMPDRYLRGLQAAA